MKSSRSIKSRHSRGARSDAKSGGDRSSRGSLDSVVSAAPSAAPSMTRRSTRSRSMRRQGTEAEIKKQLALKKRFDAEYESKLRLFEQLSLKLQQQEQAVQAVQEGMRNMRLDHERRLAGLKQQCLLMRSRTIDCQDHIADKEAIVESNVVEIKEWTEVAKSDEVRRAFNFILKAPALDILGVLPEEVFSPETMSTFYACKRRIQGDKRVAVLRRKATVAAATAACICLPLMHCVIVGLREEQKFKRAVMRSVGVKDTEVGSGWLFRNVVQQAGNHASDNSGDAATPQQNSVDDCPPHWRKYRLAALSPTPPPRPTGPAAMLSDCRKKLESLEVDTQVITSPFKRKVLLRAKRDKEFEAERALQCFEESAANPLHMHLHLPRPYANLPVEQWLG